MADLVAATQIIHLQQKKKENKLPHDTYTTPLAVKYQYIHKAYEEQKDIQEFKALINLTIWSSEHFTTQNSTFLELLNAGQLNIFKNKDFFILLIYILLLLCFL